MKILIKECKKIMDIRVLLVIAVFTVLFYHLFLEVTIYPAQSMELRILMERSMLHS